MPTYVYQCQHCAVRQEHTLRVRDHVPVVPCVCGGNAPQILTAPYLAPDYPGYVSPATGKWVEGRRAHVEDLKRSNCRILETGETEAFIKGKADRQKAFDAEVERIVDLAAQELPL